jgi:hypothetical protein
VFRYAPAWERWHIFPPQQLLAVFSDIEHLPSAQQLILPLLSFDIIGHDLPCLPWQQSLPLEQVPSLQQLLSLPQQLAPLPQQAVLPSAVSPLQQAQAFGLVPEGAGAVWVVLWAINARAIMTVLNSTIAFDFMISSEFW